MNCNSIYKTEKMWKLNLKVVLPSLLLTLLFGIYIFIDQVLMQKLIPENGINFFYNDFLSKQFSEEDLKSVFKIIYPWKNEIGDVINSSLYDEKGQLILSSALYQSNVDTIYLSITTIGTINLIFISLGFFINTGASVLYSRALAKNVISENKKIWISSFYSCLFLSFILMTLMLIIQRPIINLAIASPYDAASGYVQNQNYDLVLKYFIARNNAALDYSNNYTFFISASIPFLMVLNLLIFFIRAEGKNAFITIAGLFANILNIMFDVILFKVAKFNVIGGGIATFLGYIINISFIIGYVIYLNKKSKLIFSFIDLKTIKIYPNYFLSSFILSLGTFLRDLAIAIANIIYIPIFSSTLATLIENGAMSEERLNDIFAVSATPIYNLFFFSMYGIIDGMRPIIAYNYEQQNYKKVKQTYYIGMIVGVAFAIIVNIILFSSLNIEVLRFFNAQTKSRQEILTLLFYSMMFQLPFIAISISGLSLFQANGKMIMTTFLSLFQGLICFVPIVLIMSTISKTFNDENTMIFAGFTNILISSLLIELISEIYLHKYMGKKEKSNDPLNQINKVISWIDSRFNIKNSK